MSDHENAAPTEEVRSDEIPSIPPPPLRFSKRDLRIGGLGLTAGVLGTLLIVALASGAGSLVKTTPMADAVKACDITSTAWITVGDEGQSISMKSEGEESEGADIADLACVFGELHMPDSVMSRIDGTRALDGRQTATWKTYTASWGYHPNDGLDIVIEVQQK